MRRAYGLGLVVVGLGNGINPYARSGVFDVTMDTNSRAVNKASIIEAPVFGSVVIIQPGHYLDITGTKY